MKNRLMVGALVCFVVWLFMTILVTVWFGGFVGILFGICSGVGMRKGWKNDEKKEKGENINE